MLDKAGATVHVAMTPRAQKFVGAMTFQALTRRPVFTDLFSLTEEATIGHIAMADKADLVIIAPASANVIGRLAMGMADDAVTAVALATRAPVLVAPSMNVNMWNHPITRANLQRLVDVAKYKVVGPGNGFLACRWTGPGRLAEPEDIAEAAAHLLSTQDLAGKKMVVSAGPTYEAIDPVRFVGNRSSGKMGIALAAAAKRRGADVTLILGPSAVPPPIGVTTNHVETAAQLQWALDSAAKGADIIIMTAAVADYRPANVADEKLKRGALGQKTSLDLVANPDLLAGLGKARKSKGPLLVGFAAETEDVINNAFKKLESKNVDLIVANDVSEPQSGFAVDTNHVQLVDRSGEVVDVPSAPKAEVAHRILDKVLELLSAEAPAPKSAKPAKAAKAPKAAPKGKPAKGKKRT